MKRHTRRLSRILRRRVRIEAHAHDALHCLTTFSNFPPRRPDRNSPVFGDHTLRTANEAQHLLDEVQKNEKNRDPPAGCGSVRLVLKLCFVAECLCFHPSARHQRGPARPAPARARGSRSRLAGRVGSTCLFREEGSRTCGVAAWRRVEADRGVAARGGAWRRVAWTRCRCSVQPCTARAAEQIPVRAPHAPVKHRLYLFRKEIVSGAFTS